MAASESGDEPGGETGFPSEAEVNQIYHSVVLATPNPLPPIDEIPEPVISDLVTCVLEVRERAGGAGTAEGAEYEVLVAEANCAEDAGLGAYGDLWQPPSPDEIQQITQEMDAAAIDCLEKAGWDIPIPTFVSEYGTLIDFERLFSEHPEAGRILDDCHGDPSSHHDDHDHDHDHD